MNEEWKEPKIYYFSQKETLPRTLKKKDSDIFHFKLPAHEFNGENHWDDKYFPYFCIINEGIFPGDEILKIICWIRLQNHNCPIIILAKNKSKFSRKCISRVLVINNAYKDELLNTVNNHLTSVSKEYKKALFLKLNLENIRNLNDYKSMINFFKKKNKIKAEILFKSFFKISIKKYSELVLIKKILKQVVFTGKTSFQLAREFKFSDESHLIKFFKHYSGKTVCKYRQDLKH
ncbi:MAG: hypothetical protein PHV06_06490 [bacterium]|nr:hypothetical protein [bacterium]